MTVTVIGSTIRIERKRSGENISDVISKAYIKHLKKCVDVYKCAMIIL